MLMPHFIRLQKVVYATKTKIKVIARFSTAQKKVLQKLE